MPTHSSIHAWEIPWTEEPGGAAVHGAAKSRTRLSMYTHTHTHPRVPKSQTQLSKCIHTHTLTHTPRVPDLHFETPTVVSGEGFNFGSHTAVGGSHKSELNHLERASRV